MMLTSEQEQQLRQAARDRGVAADALLQQMLDGLVTSVEPEAAVRPVRVLGLHAGQTWIGDDFDAPLPDSFWTGAE
jgi:hypothetical protein